jgi:hypothetical protein
MADAVTELLADADRRAAMSDSGRKRVDGLSAAGIAATYAERLTIALEARRQGPRP